MTKQIFRLTLEYDIACTRLRAAKSLALYGSGEGVQPARAYYRQARRHMARARKAERLLVALSACEAADMQVST